MRIKLRPSETMDNESKWNGYYENRVIRMAAVSRVHYGLRIGDRVNLWTKQGDPVVLYVATALVEDMTRAEPCAFVTSENATVLGIAKGDQEVERVTGITLGCDPELFLVERTTGNIVGASKFVRKFGEVGYDGLLMEFRPQPSVDENVVVNNIHGLILKARQKINRHYEGNRIGMLGASGHKTMVAGVQMTLTAGFHLHYGLPYPLLGYGANVYYLARLMTLIFDHYIGIPAIIPENNQDCMRRTQPGVEYGKPGGFRLDSKTFEYRLPGGVLLRHPILSRGIIALGAVVVEDMVSRLKTLTADFSAINMVRDLDHLRALYPNVMETSELFRTICSIDIAPAMQHLTGIVEDVRKMVGYKERAASIEPFFQCLFDGTNFGKNIEANWGGIGNAQQ